MNTREPELVIAASGVMSVDEEAFGAQGFYVLTPVGRFLQDGPRSNAAWTNDDGSLKGLTS